MIQVETGQKLEKFIDNPVISGTYKNQSDIVKEGLKLLQEKEKKDSKIAKIIA
jgi:putative addiction module CopG family antidote